MTGRTGPHPYRRDPDPAAATVREADRPCADCGLPQRNHIHELPDVDPDVGQAEARRLGERERTDP